MSATVMTERIGEASPLFKARTAGVFWLMTALTGTLALILGGRAAGLAANIAATVCYVAATLFVYDLLRPVNRTLSLLAAFFSLLGCANGAAIMFFRLPAPASTVSTVCFGLHCLLVGFLVFRSAFLPRLVGALMVIAGLGWLTLGFSRLLAPALGRSLSPYLMAAGILGEISLTLWLLVRGVNVQRWKEERASAAGEWRATTHP